MNQELGDVLSFSAKLVGFGTNGTLGFWLLYAIITILSAIVYQLGFAKKLSFSKTMVIYVMLAIGCFPITIFGIRFPVAECLAISAIVLLIYKVRLHKSNEQKAQN